MKPAHHQVNVIRIEIILPHPNADKLEIVPIEGYQAVVVKEQFKPGDLAYYIPPDSIVPDRPEYAFLWGNATYEGGTPERKRRITAKKLRGEWSEGLLMPLGPAGAGQTPGLMVCSLDGSFRKIKIGDDISDNFGITHYNPPEPGQSTQPGGNEGNTKKWRLPRTFGGWKQFILGWLRGERREGGISLPTYDVEAFKKWNKTFKSEDEVYVTEKIHGSNARFTYQESIVGGKMYVGSRNLWKADGSTCVWRRALKDNPWIEPWCKAHPGYALYGEITPTQKGFNYGSDKIQFFLFDIRQPDGKWAEVSEYINLLGDDYKALVPVLYHGPFDEPKIKILVDGLSTINGSKHIREGVVVKTVPERSERNLGRAQLKIVSNTFLDKQRDI